LKTKTIPRRPPENSSGLYSLRFSLLFLWKVRGWIYCPVGNHISSTELRSALKLKTELCSQSALPQS